MSHLIFAVADDWEGIYIDGKLADEGHSISSEKIVDICIRWNVSSRETKYVNTEWLQNDMGNLPDKIEDVKWE